MNAICSSSLAPKSQNTPHQLQKLQNNSLKQFSVKMQKAMMFSSYHKSEANSHSCGKENHLKLHLD
jgi:hypothetical protein